MPIVGSVLGGLISSQLAASGFVGPQMPVLAMAIGNGIVNTILATNVYTGATVGVGPGPGVGTGVVVGLVPTVVGGNIITMMTSSGIIGPQSPVLANAIGTAFVTHMAMGVVTSAGAPVATGKGTGTIAGVVGVGLQISSMMAASGLVGAQATILAMAIGNGIELSMLSAIVNTVIVGVPAPPPAGPIPMGAIETGKLV